MEINIPHILEKKEMEIKNLKIKLVSNQEELRK
jgi:hypothetical protein